MDNQLSAPSGTIGTVGKALENAPSVVMTELQHVEQLVYSLYNKLDSVIAPTATANSQSEPTSNLLSSRLHLVSTTLEHILTNIEL